MINTIEIPGIFVSVCGRWYDGTDDLLYAVCSTGGLTTGTICPITDYNGDEDRDVRWYYTLWLDLFSDVGRAARAAERALDAHSEKTSYEYLELCMDCATLKNFETWVDNVIEGLVAEYPALDD